MSYSTRAALFLLLCAGAAFFALRERDRGNLATFERTYVDWLRGNSKVELSDPSVALIRVDTDTPIFGPWPPSALDYSFMLRRLQLSEPKVIAVVPTLFWEEDDLGVDTLRAALLKLETDGFLLGAELEDNPAAERMGPGTLSLLGSIPPDGVSGDLEAVPAFTAAKALPDHRLAATGRVGFTAIDLADSGASPDALSVPLLGRHGDTLVPSFVLRAAMLEHGVKQGEVRVRLGDSITLGGRAGGLTIPIDSTGAMRVFADLRASLPSSNANILVVDPEAENGGPGGDSGKSQRDALSSRVVLIGTADPSSLTEPLGDGTAISRAELFALALATIQSGRHMQPAAAHWRWAVWAAIVAAGLFALRKPRGRAVGIISLATLLFFVATMLAFQSVPRWIPPAVPVALLATSLVAALTLASAKSSPELESEPDLSDPNP